MYCVQTDYNNDGRMDLFIPRGAWLPVPIRPSLLRNNGDGTFTDVTREAGLLDPVNSNSACVGRLRQRRLARRLRLCEQQPNRLYHNRGDGTFEEVAAQAGLPSQDAPLSAARGSTWIDFDNDDYPDLFVNNLDGRRRAVSQQPRRHLHRRHHVHGDRRPAITASRAGPGTTTTTAGSTSSPPATTVRVADVVKGLLGQPHARIRTGSSAT